ncbi:hypothetical protein EI555_005350 [Monodon monoceros]|uniref:Uncharacterized protein n=1 Tax=Monodon monoceros TaxID=40151 RepID=A0A4U1EP68_MONMO|nr:hypothetical protein EI555_005350 [Monodon monoceros]
MELFCGEKGRMFFTDRDLPGALEVEIDSIHRIAKVTDVMKEVRADFLDRVKHVNLLLSTLLMSESCVRSLLFGCGNCAPGVEGVDVNTLLTICRSREHVCHTCLKYGLHGNRSAMCLVNCVNLKMRMRSKSYE